MKKISYLLVFLLTACNSSAESDLENYIKKIKSRAMQKPEPIIAINKIAKINYSADENLNPFKLMQSSQSVSNNRIKDPLENFPLESLTFVGLMKTNSETSALISRKDGQISAIKIGNFIGKKEALVTAINDKYLQLEESIFIAGKLKKKVKKLYMVDTNVEHQN
ncbi:MAG: pilus assembly protein PilP [Tatlockia sp.]|nr:pilus assembly protein PilP [Tatlockia sp.]